MTITVGICTYNRASIWRRGLLVSSLNRQTDKEFNLIIVDDNSSDETCRLLTNVLPWRRDLRERMRVVKCLEPKNGEHQLKGLAQNVLFREVEKGLLLMLDDDGWIDARAIQYIRQWYVNPENANTTVYGKLEFHDEKTLHGYGDCEGVWGDIRTRRVPRNRGIHKMKPADHGEWGAMWIAPVNAIKATGGNDMKLTHFRKQDCRIGHLLTASTTSYFCNDPRFTFHHLGLSWMRQCIAQRKDIELIKWKNMPFGFELGGQSQPTPVNGGASFFEQKTFPIQYELVESRLGCKKEFGKG